MGDDKDRRDKTVVHTFQPIATKKEQAPKPESAYFIVIQGSNVGRMYKLAGDDMVIGRGLSAHVRIEDDGVSRAHAQLHREADGRVILTDLGSTNGTFANGDPVTTHLLADGDKVQIGRTTILKFSYQDDIEETYQRQMYESATKDALTGIANRRVFIDRAVGEFAFAVRHEEPMSLLIFDIDHFKKINDTHGHPAGDVVLRELAVIVAHVVRHEDLLARYGGEEFAILARGIDKEGAFVLAERVRRSVENHAFVFEGTTIPVTVSVGVATLTKGNFSTIDDLLQAADQFLYKAKEGGRNRVECDLAPA